MRLQFAFLADYALGHPDGKMYVIGGGVDTLYARSYPTAHPNLSLVVKVEFTPAECGRQHSIEVHAMDSDGNPFLPPAHLQVSPERNPQAPTLPVGVQMVLGLQQLLISKPGEYAFSILVDNQELASVPLRAVILPEGQTPPWPGLRPAEGPQPG